MLLLERTDGSRRHRSVDSREREVRADVEVQKCLQLLHFKSVRRTSPQIGGEKRRARCGCGSRRRRCRRCAQHLPLLKRHVSPSFRRGNGRRLRSRAYIIPEARDASDVAVRTRLRLIRIELCGIGKRQFFTGFDRTDRPGARVHRSVARIVERVGERCMVGRTRSFFVPDHNLVINEDLRRRGARRERRGFPHYYLGIDIWIGLRDPW